MDENLSWKIILVAVIFSLAMLGVVYYFISPRESEYFSEEKTDRIAEFKNTRVSGRKEGKPLWEFYAKEGWSTRNQDITYLISVSSGKIYKDGKAVVAELTAPRAKAFRLSEVLEISGDDRNRVTANLDLAGISDRKNRDWAKMTANQMQYTPKMEQTEISGNVNLVKKDTSIFAQKIVVNHEKNLADVFDKISLKRKDGVLYSDNMQYLSDSEKLVADGHLRLTISEDKIKTRIEADRALFYSDAARDMRISGNVRAAQGKKFAVADDAVYSQPRNSLHMKGNVKAIFERAEAALKETTAENLKSKEAREIMKEKTILTSGELVFSTKTGGARAGGSVFVTQKGREAKSDQAVYNDATEILILTGNVHLKKADEWVKAEKIVISVKDETFEAIGQVKTEFKL